MKFPYIALNQDGIVMLSAIAKIHCTQNDLILVLVNGNQINAYHSKNHFDVYKAYDKLITWIDNENKVHNNEVNHHAFDLTSF